MTIEELKMLLDKNISLETKNTILKEYFNDKNKQTTVEKTTIDKDFNLNQAFKVLFFIFLTSALFVILGSLYKSEPIYSYFATGGVILGIAISYYFINCKDKE